MSTQVDRVRSEAGPGSSPYQGLMPYTEADAEFFFGRDVDILLISNNARAYRFTLLYGPSGVGKSSVLRAGVVRHIRTENEARLAEFGAVETVVAYLKEWRDDPYAALAGAVQSAFEQTLNVEVELTTDNIERDVAQLCETHDVDLLLILDQFEEFFLYHRTEAEDLAETLARLTDPSARVNVLIAIREDALARLDEFESEIPGVFENTLRLEHLDEEAARAAISGPLDRYNQQVPAGQQRTIEPGLVDTLLDQVQAGRVRVDSSVDPAAEHGGPDDERSGVVRIEAPYLQLVLTRLWNEEEARGSAVLRASTLTELGGAQEIVRQHLDRVMHEFDEAELAVLADAFGLLVTPSGSKIAHRASDLAELSGHDPRVMADLLHRLGEGEQRILRDVPAPLDEPEAESRYEIFHDVLALAVLDWRRRFLADADAKRQQADLLAENERVEEETRLTKRRLRRARLVVSGMALLLAACLVLTLFAVATVRKANDEADRADQNAEQAEQNLTLDELHGLLDTDPSEALIKAEQGWQDDSSPAYQDSFREALDAADTDVKLILGSPVVATLFVGDADLVTVTEDGMVRRWPGRDGTQYQVAGSETAEPELSVDVTPGDGDVEAGDVGDTEDIVLTARLCGDGRYVAIRTDEGKVLTVELDTGAITTLDVSRFPDEVFISVPPDGKGALLVGWDFVGNAVMWDVTTGEVVDAPGLGKPISGASIDPTGKYLAVASLKLRIEVWNLRTGERVATAPVASNTGQAVRFATVFFTRGAGPTLQVVVTGSYAEVFTWKVLDEPAPVARLFSARQVFEFQMTGDGDLLIAADKYVGLHQRRLGFTYTEALRDWVYAVDTAPGTVATQYALGGREGEVHLYEVGIRPPHPLWRFEGHRGEVTDVDFTDDGRYVATGSRDGSVRVWHVPDRTAQWHDLDDWMLEVAFTADGEYLFGSTAYGKVVRLDPTQISDFRSAFITGLVTAMSPAPDGSSAVVETSYCDLPAIVTFDDTTAPTLEIPNEALTEGCFVTATWGPDPEQALIVGGTLDGKVVAWDSETGKVAYTEVVAEDGATVHHLAVSGDGGTLAALSGYSNESTIHLRQMADGATLQEWSVPGADTIAISHDGRYVATSANDERRVRVWDAEDVDRGPILTLEQAEGTLTQVSFSPDEDATRIAVGTSTGRVYVWERSSGRLLAVLRRHADSVNEVVFDPDDIDQMVSTGDDGNLVSYSCEVCSLEAAELEEAAQDRLMQVIDLR